MEVTLSLSSLTLLSLLMAGVVAACVEPPAHRSQLGLGIAVSRVSE